ncbi:MAG: TetR/AcrR family transcriptional regulator [Actinomycetota bacterium]
MTSATPTAPRRGRRRSEDRTEAILEHTYELVNEHGYDQLRMQDVAERAGAGLATIYRRFPTKQDLVAAAIRHRPPTKIEPTGDPRADLHALAHELAIELCNADKVAGFIIAVREHEVLRDAVRDHIVTGTRVAFREGLSELLGSAEVGEFLVDAAAGALMFRTVFLDETPDPDEFADEVIALVDSLRAS